MKKLLLILAACFFATSVLADNITLNSNETLAVPTAAAISEWEVVRINAADKVMRIKYRWRDASNNLIQLNRHGWHYWTCQDKWEDLNPVSNDDCVAAGDPDPCCTGVGTGICDDLTQTDTCFSDVFGFAIRTQDVGMSIGVGLRTLIWNEMKQDILSGGNDGTFN